MDYRSLVEVSAAWITGHWLKCLQYGLQVIGWNVCNMHCRSLVEVFVAWITDYWLKCLHGLQVNC